MSNVGATSDIQFTQEALRRVKKQKKLGQENSYVSSHPGAFEQVACVVTEAITDAKIRQVLGDAQGAKHIVDHLHRLATVYRKKAIHAETLPEMPDLVLTLQKQIERVHANKGLRMELYDILSELAIPTSMGEDLLWSMDRQGDIEHPLAFCLTMQLAHSETAASTRWIREQQQRRSELVSYLSTASPQELLDNYRQLQMRAKRLVISHDLLNKGATGKIGLEIEFGGDNPSVGGLDTTQWSVGTDGINKELRRADTALEYDENYVASFGSLAHWFRDNASHLSDLHIHLDRKRHPNRPVLGGILGSYDETIRLNDLDTWEVRGLIVPTDRVGTQLSPSTTVDAIDLYIASTQQPIRRLGKLRLSLEEDYSQKRLTWGHMTVFIHSGEGRLAALKSLEHPYLLKSIDPCAFTLSYERESLGQLATGLQPTISGEYQKNQYDFLMAYIQGDENLSEQWNILRVMSLAPTEFHEELARSLNDRHPDMQKRVLEAMSLTPSEFHGEITRYLESDNPKVRTTAVKAMRLAPSEFRSELSTVLDDEFLPVRRAALEAMSLAPNEFGEEFSRALNNQHSDVRFTVIVLMFSATSKYRAELTRAMNDENLEVKANAIYAMSLAPIEFRAELNKALDDDNPELRVSAVRAMRTDPTEFHDEFIQALNNQYADVRLEAVRAMSLTPSEFRSELSTALNDENSEVRENAIYAMSLAPTEFHEELTVALSNQYPDVRQVATKTLGFGPTEFR